MEKKRLLQLLPAGAAVLILLTLGALLGGRADAGPGGSDKYPLQTHAILVENLPGRENVISVRQDGRDLGTVEGDTQYLQISHDLAHTRAAFTANHRDDRGHAITDRDLYLVEDGKILPIADHAEDFRLALDGDGLAYFRQEDPDAEQADLYLYRGGKSTLIAEAVRYQRAKGFAISPDGSAVAWRSNVTAYYYDGERTMRLGNDLNCRAISPGGELLYLQGSNTKRLFVQRGGDNSTRTELGIGSYKFFNRDLTQAVYTEKVFTGDGPHSFSRLLVDGAEAVPLDHDLISPLLPLGTQVCASLAVPPPVIGMDSFEGACFWTADRLVCRMGGDLRTYTVLAEKASQPPTLCADGETLVYRAKEDGGIYRLRGTEPELLLEGPSRFTPMDDGESVYYRGEGRRLFYQEFGGEPVLVAEDYDEVWPGARCGAILYTVRLSDRQPGMERVGSSGPVYAVYAARDGVSRLIARTEGALMARHVPRREPLTDRPYGMELHARGEAEQYHDYYFEMPWAYDRLWRRGR